MVQAYDRWRHNESRPPRARGLKPRRQPEDRSCPVSRPPRARGLKPGGKGKEAYTRLSHPSRARGLKLHERAQELHTRLVAPLAGAWIETDRSPTPSPL